MKQFIDDLIEYISGQFESDTDIAKAVKVVNAYKQNDTIVPPQITVQCLEDNDSALDDDYSGERISYIAVQINAYCQQMKINNVTKSAQDSVLIFADKISQMLTKQKAVTWNENIIRVRRVGGTFGMPIESGATTYVSPIRFDFYVQYDYNNI